LANARGRGFGALDFGTLQHDLLIGQFAGGGDTQSSGFIAAYDLATGNFDGLLEDASGKPVAIKAFGPSALGMSVRLITIRSRAYGRDLLHRRTESWLRRLFGYLTAVSAELIEGNTQ